MIIYGGLSIKPNYTLKQLYQMCRDYNGELDLDKNKIMVPLVEV